MYRLLSLRKIRMRQLNGTSLYTTDPSMNIRTPRNDKSLCKQCGNNTKLFIRHQSTIPNPGMKPVRKKRARGLKQYAELLIVSENLTKEQKTQVRKLSSKDLNFFTTTDLNLNEFYKLKDLMRMSKTVEEHTYNDLTIIGNVPTFEVNATGDVPSHTVILPDSNNVSISNVEDVDPVDTIITGSGRILEELDPFQNVIPSVSAFQPEIPEEEPHEIVEMEEPKTETSPKKHNEQLAKQEVASRTLSAYVEMCGILKEPQKGVNALWAYKHRSYQPKCLPITQLNVYNAVLKSLAAEGNLAKMFEVVRYAKSLDVKFNVQTYASIFECFGRSDPSNPRLKHVRTYMKEAKSNGFTFDRIMNEGIFNGDERDFVLKAMEMCVKNYTARYEPPHVQYDNDLLNRLNDERQLRYRLSGGNSTGLFSVNKMEEVIERQLKIEKDGYITIKNVENHTEPTDEVLKNRMAFDEHVKAWETVAFQAYKRDFASISAKKISNKVEPYLRSIPVEDFVTIMVDEAKLIAQGSETYSPTVYQLNRELGYKVYNRFKVLRKEETGILDKIISIHTKYCQDYAVSHHELDVLPKTQEYLNTRQKWQWIQHWEDGKGTSITLNHQPWPPTTLQAIGKFLYNIIMNDFQIDINVMKSNKSPSYVPAFYTIFRHHGRIIKEEVKPHPILFRLYRTSAPETLKFPAVDVPMICPPVPWSKLNCGGYLVTPADFVRLPTTAVMQKQRLQESPSHQLYPSFDALNQLASVPWKVNKKVFDCILKVFVEGGSSKLSVPEHPSSLPPPIAPTTEMDKRQKSLFFRQKLQHRRKKAEMYSLWCDCLYRLSLANHFKDDTFWLPHNMDFRGRVYPVPPHLNHLGSDLARSMLIFAEGRPLGPNGLNWLKIHLVNLTGLKKRDSVDERLEYANEILDKVLDSADNPLDGKMWWASSDEPWQTLSCCMEIADAIRSPDPEKYISHFPVHQDGSCNGLQHYAALGRDAAGGYSVNLIPALKPQDVYSAVAALVEEKRQAEAANGLEIAKILEGFVRRKVIKQTVMTTVYGVTRFGARLQIARQLKDIDEFPKEHVWAGSQYLTSRTFESLQSMFTSSREIQDWFTDCARLISTVCGDNVEWVTPLGLPIVQPYFRYKSPSASSSFYETFTMDKFEKPNVMKQKNAFPPNFIHSLDSTHMMLTSLHCERAGITFVSVHDCYWTHPSTVHIMNKICREQFVALHSEPILENLSTFFADKYAYRSEDFKRDGSVSDSAKGRLNKVLVRLPQTGTFDIRQVLDSIYFFS